MTGKREKKPKSGKRLAKLVAWLQTPEAQQAISEARTRADEDAAIFRKMDCIDRDVGEIIFGPIPD